MRSQCSQTGVARCRRRARAHTLKGCYASKLDAFATVLLFSFCIRAYARSAPKLADYCPPEPATGQLTFKSVDGVNSACVPGQLDGVGQAVFQCWQQFLIMVNGCQVSMHTTEDQYVGPGKMPCRMFAMSGNLTGEGVEAQMWAEVDGPGLLSYYMEDSEAVAALRYDNSRQLVRDIWAFLQHFTGDLRFANDSWVDEGFFADPENVPYMDKQQGAGLIMYVGQNQRQVADLDAVQSGSRSSGLQREQQLQVDDVEGRPRLAVSGEMEDGAGVTRLVSKGDADLATVAAAVDGDHDDDDDAEAMRKWVGEDVSGAAYRLDWDRSHGPMRMYRTSETRVVVKAPTGCKYRYTVNSKSHVFESPSRHHAHVELHIIFLAVATFSVVLSVVGLGLCTYFSRKHAEYVAGYWEYQAVKDQLSSELPPSIYVRLFGEQPAKPAAAAATAQQQGGSGGTNAAAAAAPVAAVAAASQPQPQFSPAVPDHTAATAATTGDLPTTEAPLQGISSVKECFAAAAAAAAGGDVGVMTASVRQ